MQYLGLVTCTHRSLEKDIMLGTTAGANKKGKSHMWWMNDIISVTGSSVNGIKQLVQDYKKWSTLMYKIAKKRKRTKEKAMENHCFENAA